MTNTRAKSAVYLLGEPLEKFGDRVLPISKDVLRVYFHRHQKEKIPQKKAVQTVVDELCDVWAKARLPISEKRNIVRKLQAFVDTYRNICRNKKRGGQAQSVKEANFIGSINCLFDMAHHDALNQIKIEEDRLFLIDQRSKRKYVMGGVDIALAKKEERRERKLENEKKRRAKDVLKRKAAFNLVELSTSSDDEIVTRDGEDLDWKLQNVDTPSTTTSIAPKRSDLKARNVVPESLASALDRTNTSDRKAAFLLSTAAQTYSHHNVSKLPLSVSSIRRARMQHRSEQAARVKASFLHEGPLVVHFDGKLLPTISGGPVKDDRLAVLVTGHQMEKLLGVPKLDTGTGETIAQVVMDTILNWNTQDQVVGMSFDTTAVNTGRVNGACILFEKEMKKKLLWLACRHHVLEVLCGDVFKAIFGTTSGPNVSLFRRFQEFWSKINQKDYKPCSDSRLNGELKRLKTAAISFASVMLHSKASYLPREDYRELLELTLIFLGQVPPRGVHFRLPGAIHHARWMSKLIYVLKMYVFRKQFKLTEREERSCLEFGLFVALIYVKFWITCPITCDAPINDLNLIQNLTTYNSTSEVISRAAIKAITRHLWYLSQEMVPLGLFSKLVSVETKQQMVLRLRETVNHERDSRSVRYTGTDHLSNTDLSNFIGPASHLFFDVLGLDKSFLEIEVDKWSVLPSFLDAKKIVKGLKVVNDCAERGIALATTFNKSLTKQEEQKQYLFQVVENHRKRFPDARKKKNFWVKPTSDIKIPNPERMILGNVNTVI